MMQKSNIYVIMSAVFLAIIIMGGVSAYVILPQIVDSRIQKTQGTTELKLTSDPSLISTQDSTIQPYMVITESPSPTKTLSLSGTGKITVKANQAIIVLGVVTEDRYAEYAVKQNALRMTDAVSALKALGIPESDMQTIGYSINPIYNWELRITTGYQVTNTLQVTINDLTLVGDVIDKTSVAGANKISSISFTVKDEDFTKYKLQAYSKAIADVQAKAKVITEGFGITISGIQSINESYYYPVYRNTYTAMDMKGAEAQTPIISGELDVSITLNVIYLLS